MGRRVTQYVPDRGDVIWIDFNPQAGHEQALRRPALIVSPRSYNAASGLAMLCPISTKAKGYRFEVALPSDLRTQGVVISDQVRSFDVYARRAEFAEVAPSEIVDEVVARIVAILT